MDSGGSLGGGSRSADLFGLGPHSGPYEGWIALAMRQLPSLTRVEQLRQGGDGLLATGDQQPAGGVAGRDDRRFQRRDQAGDRREVDRDRLRLRSLGGDAVDAAGGLVAEGVAADSGVVPVGDEDRAVGGG